MRNLPFFLAAIVAFPTYAQTGPTRVPVRPIWDGVDRKELQGTVSPRLKSANDLGAVEPDFPIPYMTLMLKRSDAQEAALDKLLAEQQDPASPNYQRWLTPEQYAEQFGASQADVDKITGWLRSQGLTIAAVGRARNWVAFSGTAKQVETAFGTGIHRYEWNGKTHYANETDPAIPAQFSGVIRTIHGLNDFRLKSPRASATPRPVELNPKYNSKSGNHYLAPGDVNTIYNVKSLHDAGYTGAGQKIAIVGQTQIKLDDIQQFRSSFGLPAADPQLVLVPDSKDPGIVKDDMGEADLDIEWAGAIAPDATIVYVYSDDVMNSVQYTIDQNLAPVLSMSYGSCEALSPRSDAASMRALARQANAQGMTWIAASGDDGAADCGTTAPTAGLAVDMPASIPEVTGVGGTTFDEGDGNYWNTSNDGARASALAYIPEVSWNDSTGGSKNGASGGGASTFFSKPSWQTGASVPSDGARDVPDVALAASPDHDGYLVYNDGALAVIGGTSAGAPSLAGTVALLNQFLVSQSAQAAGVGNINPRLYALAQTNPSVFHDVATGTNMVNSCTSRRNCTGDPIGFSAGPGYDQVTGLGSLDAYRLVTSWREGAAVALGTVSVKLASSASILRASDSVTLTATVSTTNGGTPTGTVTFYRSTALLGSASLSGSGNTGTASITVSAAQWPAGTVALAAQYGGDSSFSGATASASVTVQADSGGPVSITGLTNAASYQQVFAPGEIVSVFGTNLSPTDQAAQSVPLPSQMAGVSATVNGVTAPLYYISAGQVNVQIPYETRTNGTAVLNINNNGRTAAINFSVSGAAPGIFTDGTGTIVPHATARRGDIATLFITGQGALSTWLPTGSGPATGTAVSALPRPSATVSVSVGGVPASIQFAGNPAGLAGVTQINYQVPPDAASGPQAVVVVVAGIASTAATLSVAP